MFIDFAEIPPRTRYKLLTASVMPRPIALVTTVSDSGIVNAAPFSFFNVFSEDPAYVVLGLEGTDTGAMKHTTANIDTQAAFVVNLVDEGIVDAMAVCAARFDPDTSELTEAGLTSAPSQTIPVPGIAEAPFRLECRLFELKRISDRRHLCIGEVVGLGARAGLVDPVTFHVSDDYAPVGRLYANLYSRTDRRFTADVPQIP